MRAPLGVQLQLLIGPTVALPAAPLLVEALQRVEVTHSDEGRSGFQLTFQAGRGGPLGLVDYPPLLLQQVRPFHRVIIVVVFGGVPRVLMDGVITSQQLAPGSEPGTGVLTVTGEDVSVMLDMEERSAEHPAQPDPVIAALTILRYPQYGLIPLVIPPGVLDVPLPTDRIPNQRGTDLGYLQQLAQRNGYVFYVIPGPLPGSNIAYWGPPIRAGVPQRALSVNLGPHTNVETVTFQTNALAPAIVTGEVQDRRLNVRLPVMTFAALRMPLAAMPAIIVNQPYVRRQLLQEGEGLTYEQAMARAQAVTDASTDNVVTGSGTLDALRYGDVLMPRTLVGMRGVGCTHDGLYYVKRVSHSIGRGEYKQGFTITRDGTGALAPVVVP